MFEMLKMRAVVSEKRTEQQKQLAEVASRESSSYETKQPPETLCSGGCVPLCESSTQHVCPIDHKPERQRAAGTNTTVRAAGAVARTASPYFCFAITMLENFL